jgi:hypothetical protein
VVRLWRMEDCWEKDAGSSKMSFQRMLESRKRGFRLDAGLRQNDISYWVYFQASHTK